MFCDDRVQLVESEDTGSDEAHQPGESANDLLWPLLALRKAMTKGLVFTDRETLQPLLAAILDVEVVGCEQYQRAKDILMLAHLAAMFCAQSLDQQIAAVDEPGWPRRCELFDGGCPFDTFGQLGQQAGGLRDFADFLVQRTDVAGANGFPELTDVRHVREHEEVAVSERLLARHAQ